MAVGAPVRRRSRDSGCQWLAIGMALGMGCSLVFFLTSYVLRIVEIPAFGDEAAAPTIVVRTAEVTATPLPTTPTPTPQASQDIAAVPTGADATEESTEPADVSTNAPPTRLPEASNTNNSAISSAGTTEEPEEIGTEVPASGSPSRTPAIGSGGGSAPTGLEGVGSPMVEIPGGSFTMGTTTEEGLRAVDDCITRDAGSCTQEFVQDAIPPHSVSLDDFQLEVYEVSVTQYVRFLNYLRTQNPGTRVDLIGCSGQPCVLTTADEPNALISYNGSEYEVVNASFYGNHPVIFVTWYGADTYCRTLERRLPTEAEWERAARGPANSIYPWGPEWVPTNANTSRSTEAGQAPMPVDSYPTGVGPYGAYNMAGNVSEWVFDFYQSNYYALPEASDTNPRGPASSDQRVIRGGAWDEVPLFSRSVHRTSAQPGSTRSSLGFRCAANPGVQ